MPDSRPVNLTLFRGDFHIGDLTSAWREFIGPREPFGQALRRRAAEAEAETLGWMGAFIEHHYDYETAQAVLRSFGVEMPEKKVDG